MSSIIPIDSQGLAHFVKTNGKETNVIVIRTELTEEIDNECMQRALEKASKRYVVFHSRLISTGKGLAFEECDCAPVLQKEDKKCHLGSEEPSHFPYRVSCTGKKVTVSIHHGVTDGHGATEFVKTLLFLLS